MHINTYSQEYSTNLKVWHIAKVVLLPNDNLTWSQSLAKTGYCYAGKGFRPCLLHLWKIQQTSLSWVILQIGFLMKVIFWWWFEYRMEMHQIDMTQTGMYIAYDICLIYMVWYACMSASCPCFLQDCFQKDSQLCKVFAPKAESQFASATSTTVAKVQDKPRLVNARSSALCSLNIHDGYPDFLKTM